MTPLAVHIKHAAKTHDVLLDPDQPPSMFKDTVYQVTGVPPDRMKIMIKGGILKNDTDWKKVKPKDGQTFRVIGAAGELPKPPEEPTRFIEDMTREELKEALTPAKEIQVGLNNLGNTCYMNAIIQTMRAIPELQTLLNSSELENPSLASALRDLYALMEKSKRAVTPENFLQQLHTAAPSFVEKEANGERYLQQDAVACWKQFINLMKFVPVDSPTSSTARSTTVEQYLMAQVQTQFICDEVPDEAVMVNTESVLELDCPVSAESNSVTSGILSLFDRQVDRFSPHLDRNASYTQRSRISRLPSYLTVTIGRFIKDEDGNTVKNNNEVNLPLQLDALELVTDELKDKIGSVNRRLKELADQRAERRAERSTTGIGGLFMNAFASSVGAAMQTGRASFGIYAHDIRRAMAEDDVADREELRRREEERISAEKLLHEELKNDIGCNTTGLYDLVAVIAHEGAAPNEGHYTGLVKSSTLTESSESLLSKRKSTSWYLFDDNTVTQFHQSDISKFGGGDAGEAASAYVLLYKSRPAH